MTAPTSLYGVITGSRAITATGASTPITKRPHAPFIISIPRQETAGRKTDALVEFAGIYRSLAELRGVPLPPVLDGTSCKPLLADPKPPWKAAASSQYSRAVPGAGRAMGHFMRTDRYCLTAWTIPGNGFKVSNYATTKRPRTETSLRLEFATLQEISSQFQRGWKGSRHPVRN